MKTFRITGIAAGNVANLDSIYIEKADRKIIVTGPNGAGKSTLAKVILWVLMGGTADGEKLIPVAADKLPYAEIELTDGVVSTRLRKEIVQFKNSSGKISRTTNCFMNGFPCSLKDFQEFFNQYVSTEIFQILIGLGNFFKLKSDVQRQILTENFSELDDAELLKSADFVELRTPDIKKIKALKNDIATRAKTIPAQIDILTAQIKDVVDNRKELETEIESLEFEYQKTLKELAVSREPLKKLDELKSKLSQANSELQLLRSEYALGAEKKSDAENKLEQLRVDWKGAAKHCPTCEQKISGAQVDKVREKIMGKVTKLQAEINSCTEKLKQIEERGKSLNAEVASLKAEIENQNVDTSGFDTLSEKLNNLRRAISERQHKIANITAQLERNVENQFKINELMAKEKSFGQQLSDCDFQLNLAQKFISRKMQILTDSINSHFQFVKFKMFETLKNGEVQNVCEATLDGVSYNQLSKGEKFKVALDLLKTFQNHFGVMFPLVIDDAESYTSNSLITLENQLIVLIAVDKQNELQISCGNVERRKAA